MFHKRQGVFDYLKDSQLLTDDSVSHSARLLKADDVEGRGSQTSYLFLYAGR
jgi:hypothetical protein